MKFQLCSDLKITSIKDSKHLSDYLKPEADILLVCGNISRPHNVLYAKFLKYASTNFKKVFILPGRYEYMSSNRDIENINKLLEIKIQKYQNIKLLNNGYFENDDYVIIGSVLWSNISGNNQANITNKINDFRCINADDKNITIAKINDYHNKCLRYISGQIKEHFSDEKKNKKKILITNYIPVTADTIKNNMTDDNHIDVLLNVGANNNVLADVNLYEYYFSDNAELCKQFDACCFSNFDSAIDIKIDDMRLCSNPGRNTNNFVIEV
jgi:predicted phosphohydrolase